MPATRHSPADVLAQLLVDAGKASAVAADGTPAGDWPVYATAEPDSPDACVTVYNTEGYGGVRNFHSGTVGGTSGFMVRVRAATHTAAHDKAQELHDYLAETLYNQGVSLGSRYYRVLCCEKFGDIRDLGKDAPDTRRSVVTFNAQVQVDDETPA